MPDTLVLTKLAPPVAAADTLRRDRLFAELLSGAPLPRLVTVTAPAGYGKSTALAQLAERLLERGIASAWVSLDEEDNDPRRLLAYLATAIDRAAPGLAQAMRRALGAAGLDIGPARTTLINALALHDGRLAIVLDDLHTLHDTVAIDTLDWLVRQAPPGVCWIVGSRSEPPLCLALLRARGWVHTLDARQLAARADETARYLNDARALGLRPETVDQLHGRTEGWFTGLQLAAAAMTPSRDRDSFAADFSGNDRDVTAFLGTVVLEQQPPELQRFLLLSALLDRFSVAAAEAVTGLHDTRAILDRIASLNLFLIPLDRRREWYRYHHLFAQFLRERAHERMPDQLRPAWRRAALWFSAQGLTREAIRYASAAGDPQLAAGLLASIAAEMVQTRGEGRGFLQWADALPDATLDHHPEIRLFRAWSYIELHRTRDLEAEIARLRHLQPDRAAALAPRIDMIRAAQLALADRSRDCLALAHDWLARYPATDPMDVGTVCVAVAVADIGLLNFSAARSAIAQGTAVFSGCGGAYGLAWLESLHGVVALAEGRPEEAARVLEKALERTTRDFGRHSYATSLVSLVVAALRYERGELTAAEREIERVEENSPAHGIAEIALLGFTTRIRIPAARGDFESALDACLSAEATARCLFARRVVDGIIGERIALLLRLRRLSEAVAVADTAGFLAERPDAAGARIVDDHAADLARARILAETGKAQDAVRLLTPRIESLRRAGWARATLEASLVRAHALALAGEDERARRELSQALRYGLGLDFFQIFLDELRGPALQRMAEAAEERRSGPPQPWFPALARLLDALGKAQAAGTAPTDRPRDVITDREVEILELISAGLSNRDIGRTLFISEETVKWHLKKLYAKLDVRSRTAALAEARRWGLLPGV